MLNYNYFMLLKCPVKNMLGMRWVILVCKSYLCSLKTYQNFLPIWVIKKRTANVNVFKFLKFPVKWYLSTMQYKFFIYNAKLWNSNTNQFFLSIVLFLRKLQPKTIINRQMDKFTTRRLRKFLERDHHKAEIFQKKKN